MIKKEKKSGCDIVTDHGGEELQRGGDPDAKAGLKTKRAALKPHKNLAYVKQKKKGLLKIAVGKSRCGAGTP